MPTPRPVPDSTAILTASQKTGIRFGGMFTMKERSLRSWAELEPEVPLRGQGWNCKSLAGDGSRVRASVGGVSRESNAYKHPPSRYQRQLAKSASFERNGETLSGAAASVITAVRVGELSLVPLGVFGVPLRAAPVAR